MEQAVPRRRPRRSKDAGINQLPWRHYRNHYKPIEVLTEEQVETIHDASLPSGNALAVEALVRLGRHLGREDFLEEAQKALQACGGVLEEMPRAALGLLLALDLLGQDGEVTVEGSGGRPPFTYSADGLTFSASGNLTGLPAGDYWIKVKDSGGCLDSVTTYAPFGGYTPFLAPPDPCSFEGWPSICTRSWAVIAPSPSPSASRGG